MEIEQLIKMCGEDFRWLKKRGHGNNTQWLAQGRPHPITMPDVKVYADTPLEAMRILSKKLNKQHE